MKKFFLTVFILFAYFCVTAQTNEDVKVITSSYDKSKIIALQNQLFLKAKKEKDYALSLAKINNWPIFVARTDGGIEELMKVGSDGKPVYFSTDNANAAKATRANQLHSGGAMGLQLDGQNMVARVWDGGRVRATHNFFSGRVTTEDDISSTSFSMHATHVTGTVVASAASTSTKGMAHAATAKTYNWSSDESEVLGEVLNGMLLSNHSYGIPLTSTTQVKQPAWIVGSYIQEAKVWDEIAYLSPNYLMVTSAGNSGLENNSEPSTGGFDKLIGNKISKNVLTVANAQDVLVDANGNITSIIDINPSSSQGPADDGRIKPDITGNGTSVLSASGGSNSATTTLTGTSMSSPNVMGTLLLVQQHYKNVNNSFMKAATLKGLATHTADDAGNYGPDAIFGWGLLNAKKCVEAISQNGLQSWISEETLRQGQSYNITLKSNGIEPLIASITWTDVPGFTNNNVLQVNSTTPALVNDLDIRISRNETTYFPWKLGSDASAEATRLGDNNVDNVENIKIDAPTAGNYTISVSHKGTLTSGIQKFSVVATGLSSTFALNEFTSEDIIVCGSQNAVYNFNYKQIGSGTTSFSASGLPAGAVASFSNASLSANGTVTMTISNLINVLPGIYTLGIVGNNGSEIETRFKTLQVYNTSFQPVQITQPINNINDAATVSIIKWIKNINAESYKVEISTNINFTNIIASISNITEDLFITSGLNENTTYYCRVLQTNRCGNELSSNSITRKFTTGILQCGNIFIASDFSNSTIATSSDGLAIIPVTVAGDFKVGDINVSLKVNHTYVQDMTISLIGPSSIGSPEVFLTKETCGEFNNIDAIFDDAGGSVDCSSTPPSISGTIVAVGKLSNFNGLLANGVWTIKVVDPYDGDGGSVLSASLSICNLTQSTLGASYINKDFFEIYPNPTSGVFQISSNSNIDFGSISVHDIQGRVVYSKNLGANNSTFDISHCEKGVYFVVVSNTDTQFTKKLILQ